MGSRYWATSWPGLSWALQPTISLIKMISFSFSPLFHLLPRSCHKTSLFLSFQLELVPQSSAAYPRISWGGSLKYGPVWVGLWWGPRLLIFKKCPKWLQWLAKFGKGCSTDYSRYSTSSSKCPSLFSRPCLSHHSTTCSPSDLQACHKLFLFLRCLYWSLAAHPSSIS